MEQATLGKGIETLTSKLDYNRHMLIGDQVRQVRPHPRRPAPGCHAGHLLGLTGARKVAGRRDRQGVFHQKYRQPCRAQSREHRVRRRASAYAHPHDTGAYGLRRYPCVHKGHQQRALPYRPLAGLYQADRGGCTETPDQKGRHLGLYESTSAHGKARHRRNVFRDARERGERR